MSPGLRVRLFDADGHDRDVDLAEVDVAELGERHLLWADVDLDEASLDEVGDRLGITSSERQRIEKDTGSAHLSHRAERLHLTLEALEPESDSDDIEAGLVRREIDLLASPGVIVSCHRGRVRALERFVEGLSGESSLGALSAADMLSSLSDEVLTGYQLVVERIEQRIDRLDQEALDGAPSDRFLAELVAVRRRIGFVRRTLAPHRPALAALARPEMEANERLGRPWPGLVDRIEGTLTSVEALRDALLGTYDIHMGRTAQRANDVMRALTVLSAIFLPAVVLAGIMGMNFPNSFFEEPGNFYLVIGAMATFAIVLAVVARWRSWI